MSLPWLVHGKESWNALLLTLNRRPDAGLDMSGVRISPITPVAARPVTGFSTDQLARAASGSTHCCCLLLVSGSSWDFAGRTVALRHSACCRLSRWPGTTVGKGADRDVDEISPYRADRQSNLARSSGGFIALVAGAKSDRKLLLVLASSGCVNLTSRCKRNWRNQHLVERLLETEESVPWMWRVESADDIAGRHHCYSYSGGHCSAAGDNAMEAERAAHRTTIVGRLRRGAPLCWVGYVRRQLR